MADTPYMQLWPTDYLADTRHLTAEQHGAYMLLIMEAWLRPKCSLPDDDALLSRLCCMTPAQWKKNKPTVMAFWSLNKRSKEWVQKRLQKERKKATQKSAKASDSAASRWKDKKKDNANAMRTQCLPETRSHKTTNVDFKGARDAPKNKTGFVKQRTAVDAAMAAIERRSGNDEHRKDQRNSEAFGNDVQFIPAIGNRRR